MIRFDVYPSPFNPNDKIAESIFPNTKDLDMPTVLDLRKDLLPIRSQGSNPTCLAHSCACIKEWQENKDINLNEYMSVNFIYNNRNDKTTEGMYGRDGMQILQNLGVCRDINYLFSKINEVPSQDAFDDALNYKIANYAQVMTVQGLKTALYKNGPCLISFPVFNKGPQFWNPQSSNDKLIGGHAVAVVGYTKDSFIIRNSWGSDWADKGYTYYPFNQFGKHWEIWCCIDEKSNSVDQKTGIAKLIESIKKLLSSCGAL